MANPTRRTALRRRAGQARSFARFTTGLPAFLRARLTPEASVERVRGRLEQRHVTFLTVLRRGIFENPSSPYRPLLERAGAELGDVEAMVRASGVEATLSRLYDEGVFVRLDEFKGRAPVERPGLSYEVAPEDFDNPLLDPVYASRTGGSTGVPRAVQLDFTALEHSASYTGLLVANFGLADRRVVLWRPVPPGSAGLSNLLAMNKLGLGVDRWFTQTWPARSFSGFMERAVLDYAVFACRRWGAGVGAVERVAMEDAAVVSRHVAALVAAGSKVMLSAPASSAVRVARAATAHGLDIEGTFFRTGGEPLTDGKAAAIEAAGCTVATNYSMSEVGRIGLACADPAERDDVHAMTDHIALLQRVEEAPLAGAPVGGLWVTTLHPACRKVMLNVETGDHASMTERRCGCAAGAIGLTTHLHGIGSHDKLTGEGMNFLAADVVSLVERVLPARFGGGVGDYQLVEREEEGFTRISVIVHPRVGSVDEGAVLDEVLRALRAGASFRQMMTSVLESAGSVRVVRGEPVVTPGGKVPPVHIVRSARPVP